MFILPIIAVVCIYLDSEIIRLSKGKAPDDRVTSLLYSILINTMIVLLANEFLSLFHAINYLSLVLIWGVVVCGALLLFVFLKRKKNISLKEIAVILRLPKLNTPVRVIIAIMCIAVLYMALRTVPYNWDSMTYHLTRIVHWVQNGSVAHYACHDISQISGPPLAEFVNLHVYILSGNTDYFVNLLQAASYIISGFLVYKISTKIGCSENFSSLAMLMYATTSIVFGEALSTQVDLFAGLWIVVFAYFVLQFIDRQQRLLCDRETVINLLAMGISAGFCYLSKPSGCIAVAMLSFWLFVVCIFKKESAFEILKSVAIVIGTAVVIVLPEILRNIVTFHAISSEETSTGFLVHSWDIRYLLANLVQNVGYNLTNMYFDINELIDKVVYKTAYLLFTGTDVPESLLNFELTDAANKGHDSAANPLVFWLMIFAVIVGAIVWLIRKIRRRKFGLEEVACWGYVWVSLLSFLIFGTVVRWYKFITRYEIGYIALLAPAIMLIVQYILRNRERLRCIFTGMILFVCVAEGSASIQYNKANLQKGDNRIEQYFAVRGLYDPYSEIAKAVEEKGYVNIGFICGADSYEYPFWKMLEGTLLRFEHVCVENETRIYADEDFQPDCIIMVDVEGDQTIECRNTTYTLSTEISGVRLYEK